MAKKLKPTPPSKNTEKSVEKSVHASPVKKDNKILKLVAYNALGGILMVFFIYTIFHQVPGYKWIYFDMLKNNMSTIAKNPDMTLEQKHMQKLGGEMELLDKIKNETPKDAIIIMPPTQMLTDIKATRIQNFSFSYYFTFPRMLVYEDNKEKDSLYKKATHILTIGQWGIDRTDATFDSKNPFRVLALKK